MIVVFGVLGCARVLALACGQIVVIDVGENPVSQMPWNVRTMHVHYTRAHSALYVHCSLSAHDVKYVF